MPSHSISKCFECKRICWSRQKIISCSLCSTVVHARCLGYNRRRLSRVTENLFCKTCLNDALPFQSVNDNDVCSIFSDTIHDLVSKLNVLDDNFLTYDNGAHYNI